MKHLVLGTLISLTLLAQSCSKDSTPTSSTKDSTSDEFDMGGAGGNGFDLGEEDDLGMGGSEACNPVEEQKDSLVGDYQQIDLDVPAANIPEVPFAFVADAGKSVPVYSRAVQAVLQDTPDSENSIGKRSLYFKPNVRNAVKLMPNQVFLFGTESQWLEFSLDVIAKNIAVKRFIKGSTTPVSQFSLQNEHDFTSSALQENIPILLPEYLQKRLFVVERLASDTLGFELKFAGAGAAFECEYLLGAGPYNSLEYIPGFGQTESEARTNVENTCNAITKVPGFEEISCSTVSAFASCAKRSGVELLDAATIAKPKLTGSCLKRKTLAAADYAVGTYDEPQSQTTFSNVVAKKQLNTSFYFVVRKPAGNEFTAAELAKLIVADGRSYATGNQFDEISLKQGETIYVGFTTNIGANQLVELTLVGDEVQVKEDRFGTITNYKFSRYSGSVYSVNFYGIFDSVVFYLGINASDSGALIGVSTKKII